MQTIKPAVKTAVQIAQLTARLRERHSRSLGGLGGLGRGAGTAGAASATASRPRHCPRTRPWPAPVGVEADGADDAAVSSLALSSMPAMPASAPALGLGAGLRGGQGGGKRDGAR